MLEMSISGTINVFLRQALREQAIPFSIRAKTREEKYNDSLLHKLWKAKCFPQFVLCNRITQILPVIESFDCLKESVDIIKINVR